MKSNAAPITLLKNSTLAIFSVLAYNINILPGPEALPKWPKINKKCKIFIFESLIDLQRIWKNEKKYLFIQYKYLLRSRLPRKILSIDLQFLQLVYFFTVFIFYNFFLKVNSEDYGPLKSSSSNIRKYCDCELRQICPDLHFNDHTRSVEWLADWFQIYILGSS